MNICQTDVVSRWSTHIFTFKNIRTFSETLAVYL